MKNNLLVTSLLCLSLVVGLHGQQRYMEKLNRGIVAVRTDSSQVFVSWRILGDEYTQDATYNLYRGSTRIASNLSTSNFVDQTSAADTYSVGVVVGGQEQPRSESVEVWSNFYTTIPLTPPEEGYNAGDASVGDLDGDGDYEFVLLWQRASRDNSQGGITDPVYLEGLEMDGTSLWRINLGINIRAGAHYTQFMVYDFDSDGVAEIACKTAPGTRDATGNFLSLGPAATDNDSADYRNSGGWILDGPEHLTVFDGRTGVELATTEYVPARGIVDDWGDGYGNRVDRFLGAVAYLDGEKPSLIMCRGQYSRVVLAAWDYREGKLTQRWVFDTDVAYPSYAGQGNHNLSVADVDKDGRDEIVYGSMCVEDDGTGKWNTRLGHGDAMHVSDIDITRPGLERWGIQEGSGSPGSALVDCTTGEIIWQTRRADIGRGAAGDVTPDYPGMECWGGTDGVFRSAQNDPIGPSPAYANFLIWWDGDLSRELSNGSIIDKWVDGSTNRVLTLSNYEPVASINGTKSTPNLQADILGDWREEVIIRSSDNTKLVIFTTTIPTEERIYTLMHDPQYRLSVAWQNTGYNQPPHTGFFLGNGMEPAPNPPVELISSEGSEVWLEAECGDFGSRWDTRSDRRASNEEYVISSRRRGRGGSGDSIRHITYEFDVIGGEYNLWGRVAASSKRGRKDNDSFWLKIDDGDWFKWKIDDKKQNWGKRGKKRGGKNRRWNWQEVNNYNFSDGTHTLTVAQRGGNEARLDKFYIGNSEPSGIVGIANNCVVPNQPPVAATGPNLTITATDSDTNGTELITLDGSGSEDSDGTITDYIWTKRGTKLATGINPTISLSVGTHPLLLTVVDENGASDNQEVTIIVESGPPGEDHIWLEAECGTVGSLWDTPVDDNASNGVFTTILSGNNSVDGAPTNAEEGHITYNFEVSAGAYNLWARVITPGGSDDSFWVKVDDGSWFEWNGLGTNNSWSWVLAQNFALIEGSHTLTVAYREDGALLDKLYFGNDIPSNQGNSDTSCSSDNLPPIADAGIDQTVADVDFSGSETVELDGSGSVDSNGDIVSYFWYEGGAEVATGINPSIDLTVGTHTLTLRVTDEEGLRTSDQMVVTVSSGPLGTANIWFEAECGVVGSLWEVPSDSLASGGSYVTIQAGNNSAGGPSGSADGLITYNFDITGGTYNLWARVITPLDTDDSFWIRIDQGSWFQWNNLGDNTNWAWLEVQGYLLSEGNHTLTISYREDGALLDKLYIGNEVPFNKGESAQNCGIDNVNSRITTQSSESEKLLTIYPNPVRGERINIEGFLPKNEYTEVMILDPSGRIIDTKSFGVIEQGTFKQTIDVTGLVPGIYLIKIIGEDEVHTKSFFKY